MATVDKRARFREALRVALASVREARRQLDCDWYPHADFGRTRDSALAHLTHAEFTIGVKLRDLDDEAGDVRRARRPWWVRLLSAG